MGSARARGRRGLRGIAIAALVAVGCGASCGHGARDDGYRLARDVDLVTDDLGITHVYAKSDADAMYGAGYAMARDRLFQMELVRRQALGTTAAILGPSQVKGDVGARTFGFARLGEKDEARARAERPDDAALVDAWCAGVNARIDEVRAGAAKRPYGLGPNELDFVPDRWVAAHAFAVGKLLAFGLSNTLDHEILATAVRRVAPDFASKVPLSLPAYDVFTMGATAPPGPAPAPEPIARTSPLPPLPRLPVRFLFAGGQSNNWAVDGAHSANGRPLLAGDPHQPLSSPQRFWPVHVSSVDGGGSLDVIGFVFVGTPVVELGHDARVAWTATTSFADVMDAWDVTVDPDRARVTLGDGAHAIAARAETIEVKGAEAQTITVEEVPGYGVLLPDALLPLPRSLLVDGNAVLLQWTGFRATRELSAYLAMDRAATVDELDAAIDLVDVGAQNFVSADARHIDYHVHAAVPDRGDPRAHAMPWRVLPGDDAASLWTGAELGPDRLPKWRDPERGYLFSANNDPWGFTADGRVDDDPFYFGAFFANGLRAHRIEEMLRAKIDGGAKLAPADLEAMQADLRSPMADTLLPRLADALAAADHDAALAAAATDDVKRLAAALAAWDRTMRRDRGEPLIFAAFAWFAAARVFTSLPPLLFDAIADRSPPYLLGQLRNVIEGRFVGVDALTPGGRDAVLLAALGDAAAWLRARFHAIDPAALRWGDLNVAEFDSPFGGALDAPPVAIDGAADTVKVDEAAFLRAGAPRQTLTAREVSLYRMVASFDDDGTPRATIDFARGVAGDPDDPRFGDREPDWVEARHVPLAFRRDEVAARATGKQTLRAPR